MLPLSIRPVRDPLKRGAARASRTGNASVVVVALLALASATANATLTIGFGTGPKLPDECAFEASGDMECQAPTGTELKFSLIVLIGDEGTAGASFSAQWDTGLQNALGSASAAQGTQTFITVDPGPPAITVGYSPGSSPPTVTNSDASSPGVARSWNFIASSSSSSVNLLSAGYSFRAGTLTATVDDDSKPTSIKLGRYNTGVDVFFSASWSQLTPDFKVAWINSGPDGDGDDIPDLRDNCLAIANADQANTDGDLEGDACDTDDDGDGALDLDDAFPLDATESVDTDGDGVGDNADTDDDNDGVLDPADALPLDATESVDTDGDGVGDNADTDDDGDGALDLADNCPEITNADQADTDGDLEGDACDADDDNDGLTDAEEAALGTNPFLADTDNDGVLDPDDALPLDATESVDTDGDGVGDNADTDADGDGLPDWVETNTGTFVDATDTGTNPLQLDSDGDNWDDGTEITYGTDPTDPALSLNANIGKLLAPDGAEDDYFGSAVALSSSGDTAIVGVAWDDTAAGSNAGSASVFTRGVGGTWTFQQQLLAPDETVYDGFGSAVALSSSGDTAIVGAVGDNPGGSASVFTRDVGGTWTLQQQLLAPDGAAGDYFGGAVALSSSGDTAIVGAYYDNPGGSASVFTRDVGGTWTFQQQLLAPDGAAYDYFGRAVALSSSGDTAIVGANQDNTAAGYNAGSASVFTRDVGGTWTLQQQLLAPDGAAGDGFGGAVALSSSGDTAIVGAYYDNPGGSASVFTRDVGGTWTFQQQLLAPDGGSFGWAVALSSSGDTAIVGADWADTASVFTRDVGGIWTFRRQFLAPDGAARDHFGSAVALSSSGDTAIVGASWDATAAGSYAGSAYVIDLLDIDGDGIPASADNCPNVANPIQWNNDGDAQGDACDADDDNDGLTDAEEAVLGTNPFLADTDNDGVLDPDDAFPLDATKSVDTDGDGVEDNADNCPVITNADQTDTDGDLEGDACDADDDNDGVLDPDDAFPLDATESADTDSDGVGNNADTDDDGDGLPDSVETNTGTFIDASDTGTNPLQWDSDGDNWDDGTEVAFGTDPTDPASSLSVNSGKLLPPDGADYNSFGYVVALSSSGDTAIVGASRDDTAAGRDAGSASVFTRNVGGTWTLQQQLLAPDGAERDLFGYAVALSSSGDTAIVGAYWDDTAAGRDAGSASVFTRDVGGTWTLQQQLLSPDGAERDYFGYAVALSSSGDTAIVGAYGDDTAGGLDAGSASVFTRDVGGTWILQQQLDGAERRDRFGRAVALSSSGDTAIVNGGYVHTEVYYGPNIASVFTRDFGGTWTLQQQLLSPDGAAGDNFGYAVALSSSGDTAIVGAYRDDTAGGLDAGSASVFTRDVGGTWTFQQQLLAPDGAEYDSFGYAVALSSSGDSAIVGARGDDTAAGRDAGSASVFTRDVGGTWTLQQQLLAPDGGESDYFGYAVALSSSGDTAIVGARGSAYVPWLPDIDGDGIPPLADNCLNVANPSQWNNDGDAQGDACDADDDNDGLTDAEEAVLGTDPFLADTDNDGVLDPDDAFPLDATESADTDSDGVGDNADTDDDGDGLPDWVETNTETFIDATDTGTDPLLWDSDGDGLPDSVETNTGTFVDASNTGTSPLQWDSDGDNWDDGTEIAYGTDPTDPASSLSVNSGKLLPPDGAVDDSFGFSVALSSSGDTAIVGADWDDTAAGSNAGSASVFIRDVGGTWTLQQQLLAPDGAADDSFGSAVALSSSGDTAIVGASGDDTAAGTNAGSASVFTRDVGGTWTFQQQLLVPNGQAWSSFGHTVALSSSGDTAIVNTVSSFSKCGPLDLASEECFLSEGFIFYAGFVSVFTRDVGGSWTFQQHLFGPRYFSAGGAVALSSSGDTAIVNGGYVSTEVYDGNSASVFTRDVSGTWTIQQQLLGPDDGAGSNSFGSAFALSSSGDTAIVGASGFPGAAGTASVFTRDVGGTWTFQQQLLAPDGAAYFGSAFALSSSGDTAIVGAPPWPSRSGSNAGSASVFTRDVGGTWTFRRQLLAPDEAAGNRFGSAVALSSSGETAIVGAAGSAFVLNLERPDIDGDGIPNLTDNCLAIANADQADTDGDLEGDACDVDDDNDGVLDWEDAFPVDPSESADSDGDGVGDNADPDDDNDGFTDAQEAEAGTDSLDAESTPGLDYGLVAHYPFSGNADDASGNGNHGVVQGPTPVANRFGHPNAAYHFDGANDIVEIGAVLTNASALTITAWIRREGFGIPLWQDIVAGNCGAPLFALNPGNWQYPEYLTFGGQCDDPMVMSFDTAAIPDAEWHFVAVTYDGSSVSIYRDGELESSTPQTGSFDISVPLGIGGAAGVDHHPEFFSGSVDDVRIWNRALRPEEVEDVLHAEQEIDASEAFASNLFGLEQVTIVNPLEIEIPESAEGPLEGRLASFEVEVMPSGGRYLGVWPTVGPAGSGADIEVGDALGAGTPGEWELTFLPGETDATRLVYRVSPVAGSAPVVPGTLLWVAPDAIIIEALDQLLSQPGEELVLEIDFVEPGGEPLLKWVDAKIATSIPGVEATGSHSVSDVAGDAGTPGNLEYISDPISLTPAGVCSGFPDGGLFFLSPSCSEDDEFQFDPINDTVHVRVGGGSLASLLEGPGSSVSIHEGSGCDPSTELAWTDTLEPDGYSQSAFLSFAPPEASQVIFAVCLRRGSETFPLPQEVPIFMWVEFGSIFLLPSEQEVARFTIEPRCFGDLNGDYLVNNLDALAFRDCFGCSGPDCNRKCDYDLDGQVNNSDALAFRNTFGDVCEPPSTSPYPYISEELMAFGTSPAGITLLAAMSASLMALVAPVRRRRREESKDAR